MFVISGRRIGDRIGRHEQELRAAVERAIHAYVADTYGLTGRVSTVVKGANWTFVVRDGAQDRAFVRLYRTWGRSAADVASEMAVLRALESTPGLEASRPLIDHEGRSFSTFELPDRTKRLLGVFAPAAGRELAATPDDWCPPALPCPICTDRPGSRNLRRTGNF